MNNRQQELLKEIVLAYTKSAQPVSSLAIAQAGRFDVSPATIRNDMAVLEAEGFIAQPHTSSGRVPTELGYRYFIQHSLQEQASHASSEKNLESALTHARQEQKNAMRELAKSAAELSSSASFVTLGPDTLYITGLEYLFAQPEFLEPEYVRRVSAAIDRFDDLLVGLLASTVPDVSVLIGSENPLSRDCTTMLVSYASADGPGLFGLIGPVRMDYGRNISLLRQVQHLIHSLDA